MPRTKYRILAAAEELIAENGIEGATIASIARKAQVSDSLIYQHFQGKENLLFAVAEEKLSQVMVQTEEQVQGIGDPVSRLSRLIWWSLRFNDQNPGYTRILLFECRSNQNFYISPAYEMMRRHARLVTRIVKDGVEAGVFRADIAVHLVRDIVYGAIDVESIKSLAAGEIAAAVGDFDSLFGLIFPMIVYREKKTEETRQDRVLTAAEVVFSENSFSRTTISEVAQRAQVAEGTIYEYFKNKEDLLLSVAEKRFEEHLRGLSGIFEITGPLRKLRRLIRYHFMLYLTNRRFLKIFLTQILFNLGFYSSPAYARFRDYLSVFDEIIEEGKADGSFRPEVDARVFKNVFIGAFSHMAIRWLLTDSGGRHDKMIEIDQMADLLATAVGAARE
ncbi:MAG: TetR/AcrR family transcriptional regulator [Pseudomonadota bacterium]